MTLQALSQFDHSLRDITKQNKSSREHKRLKFVSKSLMEHELVERKLYNYAVANLMPQQLDQLTGRLADCLGECRICEYLLVMIDHSEERITRHVELFRAIMGLVKRARAQCDDDQMALAAIEKCSLIIYDSFRFLVSAKRAIIEVARVYHVPYYYDVGGNETIRIRSSLLTAYKKLNTTIDDLQVVADALFLVRNCDLLGPSSSAESR